MAISQPTFNEVFTTTQDTLKAELGINNPFLGKVFLLPLSFVLATLQYSLYLRAAFIQNQLWPTTSATEEKGGTLELSARIKGLVRIQATAGVYTIQATGQVGGVIPANTSFRKESGTFVYQSTQEVTLTSATAFVQVRSLIAGLEPALVINDVLTSTQPLQLVDRESTVIAITTAPTRQETVEEFRARVVESYNVEANGGSPSDYRLWVRDIAAVGEEPPRTAYPYAETSTAERGTLLIFVEALSLNTVPQLPTVGQLEAIYTDNDSAASATVPLLREGVIVFDPDPLKTDAQRGRMPTPGPFAVSVLPITIQEITVTISQLIVNPGDSISQVQNVITTALEVYIYNIRPFVAGADDPNTGERGILRQSSLTAVARGGLFGGQTFNTLTLEDDTPTQQDSITYVFGNVPNPTIIFVS